MDKIIEQNMSKLKTIENKIKLLTSVKDELRGIIEQEMNKLEASKYDSKAGKVYFAERKMLKIGTSEEEVCQELENMGLDKFVEVKKVMNKEVKDAILEERISIPNVSVITNKIFNIKFN